jgi:hypothetical protein
MSRKRDSDGNKKDTPKPAAASPPLPSSPPPVPKAVASAAVSLISAVEHDTAAALDQVSTLRAQVYAKTKVEPLVVIVGGTRFKSSRETLTSTPESLLAALITKGGPNEAPRDEKGAYLIPDRPGAHFNFILNYLRDREIDVPIDPAVAAAILAEAQHYGLTDLVKQLTEGAVGGNPGAGGGGAVVHLTEGTAVLHGKEFQEVPTQALRDSLQRAAAFTITLSLNVAKKPKKGQSVPILHKGNSDSEAAGSLLLVDQRLVVCLSEDTAAQANLTSQAQIGLKTFVHIAIVCTGDAYSLYIDGALDSTVSLPDTPFRSAMTSADRPLKVGGSDTFAKAPVGIHGSIWGLTFFPKALTAEEIAQDRATNGAAEAQEE